MSYPGFEAIFDITNQNYDNLLSLSVREHHWKVVETILAEDPAYQNGRVRKSKDLKSLISPAAEKLDKGFTYMVNQVITKSYEAKRNIGHAGQTALHAAIVERDQGTQLVWILVNTNVL